MIDPNLEIFEPQPNETFDDYCHRISSIEKVRQNLTWYDVADIINEFFNLSFSETYYRRKEKNRTESEVLEEDSSYLKLAKLKAKLSDERVQNNALVRRLSREETIKEIAREAIEKMSSKELPLYYYPLINNTNNKQEKEAILLISDWHYGIDIENRFNVYNPNIAIQRINKLKDKVQTICAENIITKLHVANLGDMIAGNIHLPLRLNSRIDVITQILEVSELLAEFINDLSAICKIKYYSVVDNHSRIDPNKNDSLQLESLCRITDWYIKGRVPGIEFEEDKFGYDICTTKILNHTVGFVHGHKDTPASLIKKLNSFTMEHFDLICSAHYHHFSADEECGTFMLANGSLMGTDDYAYDLRLNSSPSQTLIICSEDNPVETIYKINIS